MKKLLTICLLMAMVFTSQAQKGKPSKEETVKFIDQTLKKFIEQSTYFIGHETKMFCRDISFKENELIMKWTFDYSDDSLLETISILSWEKISMDYFDNKKEGFTSFNVYLSSVIKKQYFSADNGSLVDYKPFFCLYVPTDKVESIKKALFRLSEIAKEENKDPFQD